jgi:Cof subfamily protein (haloacid dehalogenase superfamily)
VSQVSLKTDYKLAFFDIDGTLLSIDGTYSQRLKKAMQNIQANGIKTAIASGRPKFAADFLIDDLKLDAAGIFYTGALVYDPKNKVVIAEHNLNAVDVLELLKYVAFTDVHVEAYTRNNYYIEKCSEISQKHSEHLRCKPITKSLLSVVGDEPVTKLLLAVSRQNDHKILHDLEIKFPQLIFAYAKMPAEPDWLFVSVINSSACKNRAFEQLLNFHSVTANQVIAFGDAHSDREFLSLAGTGVAMGNASDEIKSIADIVTLPVWEDGVAKVLECIA